MILNSYIVSWQAWALFTQPALADVAATYLANLEAHRAAAFIAACDSSADKRYHARVIVPLGEDGGLIIETRGDAVINLASIKFNEVGAIVEETHGGVYSQRRVAKLTHELSRRPFRLLAPFNRAAFKSIRSTRSCSAAATR